MPVYHFTFHAYRSWRPDHPRGYVRRNEGILPPDPEQAKRYDARAKQEPVTFDTAVQQVLIRGAIDICTRRRWRLHAVGTDPSHVHLVVSWRAYFPYSEVMRQLKNVLSYLLGLQIGPRGRRWFVRNGSHRRVKDDRHLNHLVETYLPDHPGLFWCEGRPIP